MALVTCFDDQPNLAGTSLQRTLLHQGRLVVIMCENFIFVDYENLQPPINSLVSIPNSLVIVFFGINQKRIATETARKNFGTQNLVCVCSDIGGKNSLDFMIAYYVGVFAVNNPKSKFFIISGDHGFDALIKHVVDVQGIAASRCISLEGIVHLPSSPPSGKPNSINARPNNGKSTAKTQNSINQNRRKTKTSIPKKSSSNKTVVKSNMRELESFANHIQEINRMGSDAIQELIDKLVDKKPVSSLLR